MLLDPDSNEERLQQGNVTVALMPSLNEVTQLFQFGEIDYSKIQETIDLCLDGCAKLHAMVRKALVHQQIK
jgi:exosome complex component MTR3